jgi:hypothetical protein
VTVGEAVVLVQAAAVLLLVVQLVQRGGWELLVLQGLLVVVEGERKMWVDHNTKARIGYMQRNAAMKLRQSMVRPVRCSLAQAATARKTGVCDERQVMVRKRGQSAGPREEIDVVIGAAVERGRGAN